jgi:hypothetical protein
MMDQPLLNALCESVDGAGLMRHVGAFAQRVKLSGSTGGRMCGHVDPDAPAAAVDLFVIPTLGHSRLGDVDTNVWAASSATDFSDPI